MTEGYERIKRKIGRVEGKGDIRKEEVTEKYMGLEERRGEEKMWGEKKR